MTSTSDDRSTLRASSSDDADLAPILGAAFLDDPVFGWIVPDRAHLEGAIVPIFDAFVAAFARHNESWLTMAGGAADGAALWAPPGVAAIHPDDEPELTDRLVAAAGPHAERVGIVNEVFADAHPSEPAWYLNFVGVLPPQQGQGLGTLLLQAVLDRADASGEPAYLEATSPRNRGLYERHGFRVLRELTLPDGPTAYAMWRDPA